MSDPNFRPEGRWNLRQSNSPQPVTLDVFLGEASDGWHGAFTGIAHFQGSEGRIEGQVNGDDIYFIIDWTPNMNNARGRYTGRMAIDRLVHGETFNLQDMRQQATWISEKHF